MTLFSTHQRANKREASIIAGPPAFVNFLIYVWRLLVQFLPWHPTRLLDDCDVSSALDAVHSTVLHAISPSIPDSVQPDVFLADFLVDFLHRHSFLPTCQFTPIHPLTRSLFRSKSRGCLSNPFMILDYGGVYLPLFTILASGGVYLTPFRFQIVGVWRDAIFYHTPSS